MVSIEPYDIIIWVRAPSTRSLDPMNSGSVRQMSWLQQPLLSDHRGFHLHWTGSMVSVEPYVHDSSSKG